MRGYLFVMQCLFLLTLCLLSISLGHAGEPPACPLVAPGTVFGNSWEDPETCPEPCPVNAQIQAVRDAADGLVSLPIHCAIVTHTRPFFDSLDLGGFFLQGFGPTGPAIFALIHPASFDPPLQTGDVVSLTVTETVTSRELHQVISISDLVVAGNDQPVTPFIQDVTNNTDLVTNLDGYESELISLAGTISGPFGFAGGAFQAAEISTAAIVGDPDLVMRIPTSVKDAFSLAENCNFILPGSPLLRFFGQAQATAWRETNIQVLSCPAPTVIGALALSGTSAKIEFDRLIDPPSVLANGSQFIFDNGLVASAPIVDGRFVTVTTNPQVAGLTYEVTVASTVLDTRGSGVNVAVNSAQFPGFQAPAVLRINELNANISNGCDLVELRVINGGAMGGIFMRERGLTILTFSNFTVATDDIIVVHYNTNNANCNATASTNETTSVEELPVASHPQNYVSAYDWYTTDSGIPATTNVLTLYDPLQNIIDAVLVSSITDGNASSGSEAQAAEVAAAGEWQMVGGGIPDSGFVDNNFHAHAVQDLNATSTTPASGDSIQRNDDTDSNDLSGWTMAPQSWGVINTGQSN